MFLPESEQSEEVGHVDIWEECSGEGNIIPGARSVRGSEAEECLARRAV